MGDIEREVWITGVGLVSPLGEGDDVHSRALANQPSKANTEEWAPYVFFPLAPIELDKQIPKKSDQRQMAQCQRIGTYAAGLALQSAGLKGDAARLTAMDLVATTVGGERDMAVDSAVLAGVPDAADPGAFLNQRLMNDLRPTFFLGQLPNLLAGNIAIVHGVTGSARTLLGEEAAGVDVVRIAAARVASGQSDLVLAGAGYNGNRKDLLLYLVAAGHALSGDVRPVFERASGGGGIALSSIGAFLVLEAADHARQRSAKPIAKLSRVLAVAGATDAAAREAELEQLWSELAPQLKPKRLAIISGASGAEPATSAERNFLERRALPVRATGTHIGHGSQAQFPMNVAIAALLLRQRRIYPASGALEFDVPDEHSIEQIVVTGVGRNYGEGLALLEAVGTR
jgi:3-oxoacyl-[acyl-carrier-protein] synthase II